MYHGAMPNPTEITPEYTGEDAAERTGARAAIAQVSRRVARWFTAFPPLHRALVGSAIVLAAALVVAVVVFGVTWARGGFAPSPGTEAQRSVIVAQQALKDATDQASARGDDPAKSDAVTAAMAELVVAETAAGNVESAVTRANDLAKRPGAQKSALALYACAVAYRANGSAGYADRALDLLATAAGLAGQADPEIARSVYAEYGAALVQAQDLSAAYNAYYSAATIEPASAQMFVQVGKAAEELDRPYDAAYAYQAALLFDPLLVAAQEGSARVAKAAPADATRAKDAVNATYGSGHE